MPSTPEPTDQVFLVQGDVPDADAAVPPATQLRWREGVTVFEYLAARFSGDLISHWPKGDGHPVIVLPGFMTGPSTTLLLRDVLRRLGYRAYDWSQGFNRGYTPGLFEALTDRVTGVSEREGGRAVSLVGWSVGGIFAREVARASPERVRSVITLGSPFRGNHRANHAWRTWELVNRRSADLLSETARLGRTQPLTTPTTCVYSKQDGVVAWECCTSLPAPQTENVEVHSTHWGYGHNLETLYVIADRLAVPEGQWRPYQSK